MDHHSSSNLDTEMFEGRSVLTSDASECEFDAVAALLKSTLRIDCMEPEHVGVLGGPTDPSGHLPRWGCTSR